MSFLLWRELATKNNDSNIAAAEKEQLDRLPSAAMDQSSVDVPPAGDKATPDGVHSDHRRTGAIGRLSMARSSNYLKIVIKVWFVPMFSPGLN